ncbi:hypothetical protein [Streptococcus sanguinis]|jgi:hypothetical protein|uniref:Uncharacterized protein n=1 Tax=Streptococcus sanguinis SK115 TaxID=888810 RepID=F0IAH9_STRSA|nr:hypothetical protein [Streptococcus sanguinis]EGD31137.1 hypothetical protein HMPREF9382_1814 [Streptococcus sanguinis SK115]MBZ2054051.1 hypothetical protein [Streptococcus sanguinis]
MDRLRKKRLFTIIWIIAFVVAAGQGKYLVSLFLFILIPLMIFWWRKELVSKIKEKINIFKDVKQKKYFLITESNHTSDIVRRREIGDIVLEIVGLSFVAILLGYSLIMKVFPKTELYFKNIVLVVLGIMLVIFLVSVLNNLRYYWTSLYYYIIPFIFIVICRQDVVKKSNILMFFLWIAVAYLIFAMSLPIYILRKITNNIILLSIFISVIIPIVFNHLLVKYIMEYINQSRSDIDIYKQMIHQYKIPKAIVDYIYKTPETFKMFNTIIDKWTTNETSSILGTMNFLCISSYSLGSFIINMKLKLGDSKAKEIYSELIAQEKTSKSDDSQTYSKIRDCIFYGGESYKNRIIDNLKYRELIDKVEFSKTKHTIRHNCFINLLKKLWNWINNRLRSWI